MVSVSQVLSFGAFAALAATAPTERKLSKREALPDYALTYAPWSYLYSQETWFPSDITTHLANVYPAENYETLSSVGSVTVDTLNNLDSVVYLTATDADSSEAWLKSDYGIPNSSGYSAAPGTIIAVQKNATWVDVFYFYFYSYNWGGKVLDINFDDHVGDWEHTMIRFYNGEPYAIWLSEHSAGSAYYWNAMEFNGARPVTYVAQGGHANFATAGSIEYTIAFGLIEDYTDAGYPWDMTQNYRGYWYDTSSAEFSVASSASTGGSEEGSETTSWLLWQGAWGNEYNSSSPSQFCIFSECTLTNGPTGPVAKNLGRTTMCQDDSDCAIYDNINDVTIQSKK